MRKMWRLVFSFLIVSVSAACSETDGFETIYKSAKESAGTSEGAAYDRKLGYHFMEHYEETLDTCVKADMESAEIPFRSVIELSAAGTVVAYHVDKETAMALCLRDSIVGKSFPSPPNNIKYNPFEWEGLQ